jgi:hypothetical protein
MSLKKALKSDSTLTSAIKSGKQALRREDRNRIAESATARVVDSLDLDSATRATHGGENRWDYLLGTSRAEQRLIAVEVHPANTGEARLLVAKKQAAQEVLRSSLVDGETVGRWYWIASGKTAITRGTPEARLLDKAGIQLVGSRLKLDRDA